MPNYFGGAGDLGWVAVKAALLFVVAVVRLRLGERRTLAQLSAVRALWRGQACLSFAGAWLGPARVVLAAQAATWLRLWKPSLARMCWTWFSAVRSAT